MPGAGTAAYFIACEGLTNAVKHARATRITVSAERMDGRLVISVTDDGVGGARPSRGSGLRGLSDRVQAHRGALRLENERVLTFEIHEGASGAFFEDESAQLHRRRQGSGAEGLSAIGGSDYMADHRTAGEIMTRDVVTVRRDLPTEDAEGTA